MTVYRTKFGSSISGLQTAWEANTEDCGCAYIQTPGCR